MFRHFFRNARRDSSSSAPAKWDGHRSNHKGLVHRRLHWEPLEDRTLLSVSGGIWISHEELMQLPTSGPAWETMVEASKRDTSNPDISDQDENTDVQTLAKAMVGVRTGDEALMEEARTTIMKAMHTEDGGRTLALGRNLVSYVIAADLVGLSPSQDAEFRAWLEDTRTEVLSDKTLIYTHEIRPNNWGTAAGASRAAVAVYLGDEADLARTAQVFKGYVGDRSSYAGFIYKDLSWQADPDNPVGINPAGAMKEGHSIDGVQPDDMRRGGSFQWPPIETQYPWTALQGTVVQAEILHRAGYDAWQWEDQAILRAFEFLYDIGWYDEGNDEWIPFIIDANYGTDHADNPRAEEGKTMGWTAWTHGFETVPSSNRIPVVDAGADQSILLSAAAYLDGTVTDDGLPDPPASVSTLWTVVDAQGTVTFADPTAIDTAAGFSQPGTYVLRLTADDGARSAGDDVIVTVSDGSSVPLSFQDGLNGYTGTRDTRLKFDYPDNNYETIGTLQLAGSPDKTALLEWDLGSIAPGTTVESVSMTLNVTDASSDSYEIYALNRNWLESQATWNQASSGIGWEIAGAQGASDRGSTVLGTVTAASTGLATIELNAAGVAVVQSWIDNPASNFGFIIQDFNDATNNSLEFDSSEVAAVMNRPRLDVTLAQADSTKPWDIGVTSQFAAEQLLESIDEIGDPSQYPRSTDEQTGLWTTKTASSWASGFFPGQLWMMYQSTGEQAFKTAAEEWTAGLADQANKTDSHDVGFMILNSFGHAYDVTGIDAYRETVLTAAASLATRFDPDVGATRSWDTAGWDYPVIIDNLMNIELLFWAAKNGPDPQQNQLWYDMAVSHADVTAANHVRQDGSTYQLIDFDPVTGNPIGPDSRQGDSIDSTWSRGQAWGIYGFTMAYRETGQQRFLDTANQLAEYFIDNLPADNVPYWDFDAPNIPNEPKDSSAAAIAASSLLELSTLVNSDAERDRYLGTAEAILESLSSNAYLSDGTESSGILLHGTGNKPQDSEVDVSLIYGDYYFVEALERYKSIASPQNQAPVVNAGIDQTIVLPSSATLDGTVDDDGLPTNAVTTTWSQVSGPGTAGFADQFAVDTTASFSTAGTYVLRLTASDGALSRVDEVSIVVMQNQAPVVNAGVDQSILLPAAANLDGTVTDDGMPDPPASITTAWTVVSGPGKVSFTDASAEDTTANFSAPGTYVLRLTADDGDLKTSDEVAVAVGDQYPTTTLSFQDGVDGYVGTRDTRLKARYATKNYGSFRTLQLEGDPDRSAFLKWDLSSVTPGTPVESVSMTINVTGASSNSYEIYALNRDWLESEATWNEASSGTPWELAGAQGDSDRGSVVLGTVSASSKGLLTVELNAGGVSVVQSWIDDPASNFGFAIQDYSDDNTNGLNFDSREVSTIGNRPKLDLTVGSTVATQTASPVQLQGETVMVSGTEGDDVIQWVYGTETHKVVVMEAEYFFDASRVLSFEIDAAGGNDTVVVTGGAGVDKAFLWPTNGTVTGPGYDVNVTHAEKITVRGEGGDDVAKLFDSTGNDSFVGRPYSATLYGSDFSNRAADFRYVHAFSGAGGDDVAKLFDSAGNDSFLGKPNSATLYGNDFSNRAVYFRYVHAFSESGGDDVAQLYDSGRNDSFEGRPKSAKLYGDSFFNRAVHFGTVLAHAVNGGHDQAHLYDSSGNEHLEATHDWVRLSSKSEGGILDTLCELIAFEQVTAHRSSGDDTADIADAVDSLMLEGAW